jgi:hypothetical protein
MLPMVQNGALNTSASLFYLCPGQHTLCILGKSFVSPITLLFYLDLPLKGLHLQVFCLIAISHELSGGHLY